MKLIFLYVIILLGIIGLSTCSTTNDDNEEEKETSLYKRLGGEPAIEAVVAELISRVAANEEINHFFAKSNIAKFKRLLAQHLCLVTGGGCRYSGRDMYTIHKGMGISSDDFNSLVGNLVSTLEFFNVPEEEQTELLSILGKLKGVIIEK